jgi:type I restriction enzyme, S subunit
MLPAGWEWSTVGEVASTQLGKMLSAKARGGINPVPYLRNQNVQWGRFELDDLREMDFSAAEVAKFSLQSGDLVMCEGGAPGRCAIWQSDETMLFQKALHRIRPGDRVLSEWLFYYFRWLADTGGFAVYTSGIGIPHLPQEDLRLIPVAVPPLEEQRRIVEVASALEGELDAGVEELRRARDEVREFEGSIIEAILTGASTRLAADLAQELREAPYVPLATRSAIRYGWTAKAAQTGNAQMLRITDIQNDRVNWEGVPFCQVPPDRLDDYRLSEGDIVFARTGGTTGKSYRIGEDVPHDAVFASYLIRVRPDESLDPGFLSLYFRSIDYWRYVRTQSRGIGQPNVNGKILGALSIPAPGVEAQRAAAAAAAEALKVIRTVEEEIAAADASALELRRALLREAVTGRLASLSPGDRSATDASRSQRAALAGGAKKPREKRHETGAGAYS